MQKVFLPTKICNFRYKLKTTVVPVCGYYIFRTTVKFSHIYLFSDHYHLSIGDFRHRFPRIEVGVLLQDDHNRNLETYSDQPGGVLRKKAVGE